MLATAGVVCLVAAMFVPGPRPVDAQDGTAPRPDVFRSSATALVAEASLDRDALLPISDVFRFMAVEGRGTYESSNQTAQASLIYPGNGVISGPGLLCGTFGGQFPPEFAPVLDACNSFQYPLTVRADSLQPDASSTGATEIGDRRDPISGEAVRAVAHAAADGSRTDAAMSSLRILGLLGLGEVGSLLPVGDLLDLDDSVLAIEGATSRTDQRIDDSGSLVVEATSELTGIGLLGGLVEIGTLRSAATITDDGHGTQTQDTDLEISGVTVGGIPARITADGLEIGSPTGLLGPVADQLTGLVDQLVSGLGVEVTLLDVVEGVDDAGSAFARVGGLLITFETALDGLPTVPGPLGDIDLNGLYRGSIALGQAAAVGQAAYIDPPSVGPVPVPDGDGGPVADVAAPPSAPGSPDGPVATPDSDAGADSEQPALGTALRRIWFDQPIEGRLRLVYLSFVLLALAACIAPRFAFPARLPGASS